MGKRKITDNLSQCKHFPKDAISSYAHFDDVSSPYAQVTEYTWGVWRLEALADAPAPLCVYVCDKSESSTAGHLSLWRLSGFWHC